MAKLKTSGAPMTQEQSGLLFWTVGIIIIATYAFGDFALLLCSLVTGAMCPWLIVQGAEVVHEQCGLKGWSTPSILAGVCFGLSAFTAGSHTNPFGGVVVALVCAAYYAKEMIGGALK